MQLTNVSAEIMIKIVYIPKPYLEHSKTSTMEFFPKIVYGLKRSNRRGTYPFFTNQNPKVSTLNSFVHSSALKHSKLKDFPTVVYCLIFHNNSLILMFLTRSEDLFRLCLDDIKSDRNVKLSRKEIFFR